MPGGLTIARIGGGRLHVGAEALATMLSYVQVDPDKYEAGGVLLGRHLLASDDIVVDQVTTPQLGDRRARHRYFRSGPAHQRLIDRAWADSKGTCTYLGEWHTHPELNPVPSLTDHREWCRTMLFDQFTLPIFFVIIGTAEVNIWEGTAGAGLEVLRCSR